MRSNLLFSIIQLAVLASEAHKSHFGKDLNAGLHGNEENAKEKDNPDPINQLFKLKMRWEEIEEDVNDFCTSGKFTSAWCEYRKSMMEHRQKLTSDQVPNWKILATRFSEPHHHNLARSIGRCRPGIAHCPNGKRAISEGPKKNYCWPGWPWCNTKKKSSS